MRRSPTPGERALWSQLSGRGPTHTVFRRQHLIGDYIVDFVCVRAKVIIEVDGLWFHMDRGAQDASRQNDLESQGYLVLRYSHSEVMENAVSIGSDVVELCRERIAAFKKA